MYTGKLSGRMSKRMFGRMSDLGLHLRPEKFVTVVLQKLWDAGELVTGMSGWESGWDQILFARKQRISAMSSLYFFNTKVYPL